MAKPPPRRPRSIARSSDAIAPAVAGHPVVARKADAQQPDLFAAPGFIAPCKPILRGLVPSGPLWQYELKHDGYRAQAHAFGGRVQIFTKSGRDMADRFPLIRDAVARLDRAVILDGEAVMVDDQGVTDFFALHAVAMRRAPAAFMYAFDLLWLDGQDLRPRPLAERRAMLAEVLVGAGPGIEMSEHLVADGEELLRHVCALGLEGIVAKRIDKPYRSGDRDEWVKVKCTLRDDFAVIGFDPAGTTGVRSLKLAKLLDEALVPCGAVGSGLTEATSRALRTALDAGHHVVVGVEYRGHSPAGELRHPVVRGWHADEG